MAQLPQRLEHGEAYRLLVEVPDAGDLRVGQRGIEAQRYQFPVLRGQAAQRGRGGQALIESRVTPALSCSCPDKQPLAPPEERSDVQKGPDLPLCLRMAGRRGARIDAPLHFVQAFRKSFRQVCLVCMPRQARRRAPGGFAHISSIRNLHHPFSVLLRQAVPPPRALATEYRVSAAEGV